IESLAYHGAGVGRLPDGRVAFVEDGVVGDTVLVECVENHERYVRGRIGEIITPSPHRIEPKCKYHARCGGCPWQHISYDEQCVWKRNSVVEALRRIGGIAEAENLVKAVAKSTKTWGYRNKIELSVQTIDKKCSLGFRARGSAEFVPVDGCLQLAHNLSDAPQRIAGALTYTCREILPDLHRVNIRASEFTKDVELSLWAKPSPLSRQLVARVLNEAVRTTSMTRVIIDGELKERNVKQVEVLAGRGYWREMLDGRYLKLSSPSFYQVNSPGAQTLVETVLAFLEQAEIGENDHVADLYAGAGTFTIPLAARYNRVSAVESYGSSVRDLRRNLEDNALDARVIGGDAARELSGLGSLAAAIIDPPRSGLSPQATAALVSTAPRCVVYVSCDPSTLARDARSFIDNGYELACVQPIDLFPQTYHIESVALFVLEESMSVNTGEKDTKTAQAWAGAGKRP
ncbi:MAG: 23S rRNA (uracil(1939)-C(5))-methyltransferase RlmD, partial [Coriobacteriales bacterium]|nr:23S rRNA (uracil(1939)-C(5))-methyltransferase RlmD [Coriobacteriales bacterium]